jgi:hypothetical protein
MRCELRDAAEQELIRATEELHSADQTQGDHQNRSPKSRPWPKCVRTIVLHVSIKMLDAMHEMKRSNDHGNSADDIENSHDFLL